MGSEHRSDRVAIKGVDTAHDEILLRRDEEGHAKVRRDLAQRAAQRRAAVDVAHSSGADSKPHLPRPVGEWTPPQVVVRVKLCRQFQRGTKCSPETRFHFLAK